ncbi:hypothetical protein SAMN04487897_10999 [Paenibacillus sp. yr247]|uniref:DUF6908 domain-containing protein n=1 Tax=Paenibacillus sp. yr247 TaxID=1761880 RepID=UPI00088D6EF6|nr:hypothetical protein [Paenibacillus sp. yr247]SDO17382.1 hypothetical protein SAMN04487897_10999 [Paenibacillus sp. yr247]
MDGKTRYDRINELLGGNLRNMFVEGGHTKLVSKPYMDLSIEVIGPNVISLTHYYELNGDLVPDPDMEVIIHLEEETAEALSYQDTYVYRRVDDDGKVDERAKRELNYFLGVWLNNLKEQGFTYENRVL